MSVEQTSLLDFSNNDFIIKNKVRLIEFFAGIGSQSKALEILGVPFESYKTCEWSKESIKAYKQIHNYDKHIEIDLTKEELIEKVRGISSNYNEPMSDEQLKRLSLDELKYIYECNLINHNLINISDVKGTDLEIVDTDKYTYLLSYSFPCQDLSLAGKCAGLEEGSETRSSLLWEVGRILKECCGYPILTLDEEKFIEEKEMSYKEYFEMKNIKFDIDKSKLPQILIMENVDMILSVKFKNDFFRWCNQLEELGYSNFYQVLNAKDYGIPQNRKRCFMVSILNKEKTYSFPRKLNLKYKLKDFLQKNVDEKYYLSEKMIAYISSRMPTGSNKITTGINIKNENIDEISGTLTTANGNRPSDTFIIDKDHFYDKQSGSIKVIDTYNKCYTKDQNIMGTIPATYSKSRGCVIQEPKIIKIGSYCPSSLCGGQAANKEGIAPTIVENHGNITAIVEDTIKIPEATKKGYAEASEGDGVYINRPFQKRGVVQKGSIQTLKAHCEDVGVVVKDDSLFTKNQAQMINKDGNINRYIGSDKVDEFKEGQVADISFPNGYNKAKRTHDECPTLNTTTTESSFITKENQSPLRIRKLTPCECYKLMGFTKTDYERCKEIQSNAKQCKNLSSSRRFNRCFSTMLCIWKIIRS